MKVFVTGVAGQLGHDVLLELNHRGHTPVGSDLAPEYNGIKGTAVSDMPYVSMNITSEEQVMNVIASCRPDVVVHCAAWTAVDLAEEPENRDKVFAINAK